MINQDMYVVYAKPGMFRIQDSFTPSRAKPLPDVFFGGDDGITDAIGSEKDGYTNVKFRRNLMTLDASGDYCILKDVDYLVVYAYGQPTTGYSHSPNSGLETGRASNKGFYGVDELKYHGGGIGTSFEGRGSFGSVNFYDVPPPPTKPGKACLESTMEGYECMQQGFSKEYTLYWTKEKDGVSFAVETTGSGWAGMGWPKTPGVMIGTKAVIGLGKNNGVVSTYLLEEKAPSGITEDDTLFKIDGGKIEQKNGSTVLKFKRLFDDDFDGEGEVDLVGAFHPDSNEIEYHGPTTRGGFTVKFS